ncbi:cache domain-containing protein [Crassaminicella profunda]|uniref:cache domain-containing protein n=1 Tax=Crassaminicella profunda TaxID=1286698 RepID=UPI001CA6A39D|nr:cache domain-containing protein [Crassaminicella profunda]QZY55037.1 cache domain-containing protein [Crassaminicella profunda]
MNKMKVYFKDLLMILLISTLTISLVGCKGTLKAGVIKNEEKVETQENKKNEQVEQVKEKIDSLCNQLIDADEENIHKALKDFKENTLENIEDMYFAKEDSKKFYTYPVIEDLPEDYDPRKRPWYEKAKEDEYYIDEFSNKVTGKKIIAISKAIYKDEVCIGVVGIDLIEEEKN